MPPQPVNDLDWVQVRYEGMEEIGPQETFKEKILRKTMENPFVPLGTLVTVAALTYGIFSFYKGNSKMSQYMMRTRVGAQAFTLIAITAGFMFTPQKE